MPCIVALAIIDAILTSGWLLVKSDVSDTMRSRGGESSEGRVPKKVAAALNSFFVASGMLILRNVPTVFVRRPVGVGETHDVGLPRIRAVLLVRPAASFEAFGRPRTSARVHFDLVSHGRQLILATELALAALALLVYHFGG
jgi:hypothetical protein